MPSGRSLILPSSCAQCHLRHVSSASRNLEIVAEVGRTRAHLIERPHLELASPLACHSQLLPDLDERARGLSRKPKPQFEYEAEAIVERVEDGRDLLSLQALDDPRFRMS